MIWSGFMAAIVTPFSPDAEKIDLKTFASLIQRQIEGGADGIVVCGTTGESPTINRQESAALLRAAIDSAKGKSRIIAGISGNNTKQILEDIAAANMAGPDGIMVAAPYYNKPSQSGLVAHYSAIAEATALPVMVYNIPGRTGVNITLDTLTGLYERYPHISGVKEASGDYQQIADTVRAFRGTDFGIMAGDDSMVFPTMALGGHGVVSVLGNLLPRPVKQLVAALEQGDLNKARSLYDRYLPLMRGIFIGGNPSGIKILMAEQGLLNASFRLPLCAPTEAESRQILDIFTTTQAACEQQAAA